MNVKAYIYQLLCTLLLWIPYYLNTEEMETTEPKYTHIQYKLNTNSLGS